MKKAYLLMLLFVLIFAFAGQGSPGFVIAQVGESKKDVPEKDNADAVQDDEAFRVTPKNKIDGLLSSYFKRYLKNSGLTDLSEKSLPKDDLEVRVWRDAFRRGISAFVLKRVSDEWSATFLNWKDSRVVEDYPSVYFEKPAATKLSPQVSNWDGAWRKITDAGMLTLPSSLDINCFEGSNDGTGYMVEYNFNNTYRVYSYHEPHASTCAQAGQFAELISLIRREYYTADVDIYKY